MKLTAVCCRFFAPKSAGQPRNECRRPRHSWHLGHDGRHDEFAIGIWPAVSPEGWCGEFKRQVILATPRWLQHQWKDTAMSSNQLCATSFERSRTQHVCARSQRAPFATTMPTVANDATRGHTVAHVRSAKMAGNRKNRGTSLASPLFLGLGNRCAIGHSLFRVPLFFVKLG